MQCHRHASRPMAYVLLLVCALQAHAAAPSSKQILPSEFRYDRIFLTPRLLDGTKVTFYTDSGGGFNAISNAIVARQKWATSELDAGNEGKMQLVDFPAFATGAAIPPPVRDPGLQGRLVSVDTQHFEFERGQDGFLGNRWFGDKVLELDYPGRSMSVLQGWQPNATQQQHRSALTFKAPPAFNFPRMRIEVDGKPIEVLFDTGATFNLTTASAAEFALPASTLIAGSFITKTRFEEWAAHHPDWKVLTAADQLGKTAMPMIRVAEVKIAGWTVGPVWFSQRPDPNFLKFMSAMMDQPIEGAIGGSAFKYFTVVADYPGKSAYFMKR